MTSQSTQPLLQRTPLHAMLLTLFALYTSIGAMVIGEQHGHHGIIVGATYLVLMAAVLCTLLFSTLSTRLSGLLRSTAPWLLLLALAAPFVQRHYTANQQKPNPLSSSIALEAPARALLLQHHEMYSVTANGAPISPGPGWILLWSPVTVAKFTGLLDIVALGLSVWVLGRRNTVSAGLFVLLMLVQPHFVSQLENGQDLYAISLFLVLLVVCADYPQMSTRRALLLGILGGVIATARVPIVAMTSLLGVCLWRKDSRAGTVYTVTMLLTAASLHGTFYLWAMHNGDVYQPTHYLARGSLSLAKPFMALLALGALVWVLRSKRIAANWLAGIFFLMAALFTPEGVAEFFPARNVGWEGANYICFPIPVLLAAILLRVQSVRHKQGNEHQNPAGAPAV